jgi:hypothetical protein
MEEGNRRFPSGLTNKGRGRLYTSGYFALIAARFQNAHKTDIGLIGDAEAVFSYNHVFILKR